VYIPMISLYGLLVAFSKELVELELSKGFSFQLVIVVGVIGVFAGASMLVMGKLSDTKRVRRPFIIVGLFSLGILIILFNYFPIVGVSSFEGLYQILPVTIVLAWGFGMFPPAILAYLTDISKKDTRGTMFGVYSVIFGSGMIIGPILGGIFAQLGEQYDSEIGTAIGLVAAVILFVILASIGTLFLEERAKEEEVAQVVI
ncbi:MAG: MFS transporter, partial [Candidatus Heimdallarchaeota archaeon]